MRFLEQIVSGRTVISDTIIAKDDGKDRVTRDIDAACWIEAKKNFGYPLSVVQEWLLDQFYEKRDRAA